MKNVFRIEMNIELTLDIKIHCKVTVKDGDKYLIQNWNI